MHNMSSGGSSSNIDGTQFGRRLFLQGCSRFNIDVKRDILQTGKMREVKLAKLN